MENNLKFSDLIPEHYQNLLTPFLFDGFSNDLMQRIDFSNAYHILELASGTGSTTKQLVMNLPAGAQLNATDLEAEMLDLAKSLVPESNVTWDVVDMTSIPYIDEQYDLIVCQFGLMLVPDKEKAINEIFRVLKKGGKLFITIWADIEDNTVWKITGKTIEHFIGSNPMLQDPGPFSLSDKTNALSLFKKANFQDIRANLVNQKGSIESAQSAAKGMIQGLPVVMILNKKNPALAAEIELVLTKELVENLGDHPLTTSLSAWVYEITK